MSNQKILIVEDNKDNLDLIQFLLEREGYETKTAVDGVRGVKMATEEHPDLILLDLAIPELDGWQAAEKLKADPSTQQIPLVAITAHTLPGDKRKALKSGCDGYIGKPINVATFIEQIQEHLPKD